MRLLRLIIDLPASWAGLAELVHDPAEAEHAQLVPAIACNKELLAWLNSGLSDSRALVLEPALEPALGLTADKG